jgi:hypothetical protein
MGKHYLVAFLLFLAFATHSQILLNKDSVHLSTNTSQDEVFTQLVIHNFFSTPKVLIWERKVVCKPEPWLSAVADENIEYTPGISTRPFTIDALDSSWLMVYIFPFEEEGAALIKLKIYEQGFPEDSLVFSIYVNEPDCVITSTTNAKEAELISIWPNPASDRFFLKIRPPKSRLSIRDMTGQEVYSQTLEQTSLLEIDVQQWPPGIYQVSVVSEKGKVIGQRRVLKLF